MLREETAFPQCFTLGLWTMKLNSATGWPIDFDKRKILSYFEFDYKGDGDEREGRQSCPECLKEQKAT